MTSTSTEKRKSTDLAMTADKGKITRGKYTFDRSMAFPVKEVAAELRELENRFQYVSPQNRNTTYGMPSKPLARNIYEKTKDHIIAISKGFIIAQYNPNIES